MVGWVEKVGRKRKWVGWVLKKLLECKIYPKSRNCGL